MQVISNDSCSLRDLLNRYLDAQRLASGVQDMLATPTTTWENWKRFRSYMDSEIDGPVLVLSDIQMHSYYILLEWIESAHQDPAIPPGRQPSDSRVKDSTQLGNAGIIKGYSEALLDLFDNEFSERMEEQQVLELEKKCSEMAGQSAESLDLAQRVTTFIVNWQKRSDFYQDMLQEARQETFLRAYSQRMVNYCYYNHSTPEDHDPGKGLKLSVPAESRTPTTGPTWLLERGPNLRPCPWLDKRPPHDDYLKGWPYYLFDVEAAKTVVTQELDPFPEYTAISHTWGRWRKYDEPRVHIDGVPWSIPQNKLFKVETIVNSLQKSKIGTRYIWLDLVCIPQDGSNRAIKEIGRQADIFRNASHAIAWLHDVADLSCLSALFRWLALSLLLFEPGSPDARRRDEMKEREWLQIAHKQSGLLVPRKGLIPYSEELRLNPWFTSLWTLQEVCLRPNMLLASSNWDMFAVDEKTRVPLNALLLVYQENRRTSKDENSAWDANISPDSPIAFIELQYWVEMSGFSNLFSLTRIEILGLGESRECETRRSEAIMSALGTTTWFHETDHKQHEFDLVLGKYHPAFVDEVRHAIPGDFFGGLIKKPGLGYSTESRADVPSTGPFEAQDHAHMPATEIERHSWASLLPFSPSKARYFPTLFRSSLRDHDSLLCWEVQPSGSVHIPKACILSSSRLQVPKQPVRLPCYFLGVEPEIPKTDAPWSLDLHQWTLTRPYEVHAIVTKSLLVHYCLDDGQTSWECTIGGVLLRKLDEESFFRFGNFFAATKKEEVVLPDAHNVDWTVI